MHLAIAYGNDELAQEIVAVCNEAACKMLVTTVAKGKIAVYIYQSCNYILKLFIADMLKIYLISGIFFLPRDQQHDRPTKKTNYEGLAYLGGYALAWAACLANETIYNILLVKVLCLY